MKTAQERITVTKVKSAHLETITTNLAEFNLGEAVFVHKGQFVRSGTEYPSGDPAGEAPGEAEGDKVAHLYKLINNLSMALNQHAVVINKQQETTKKYVEEAEMSSHLDKIAESVSLYDEEFVARLEIPDASRYSEETENVLANKTHKICNKVLMLGHACYYLYRKQQNLKRELDEFKDSVNQSLDNKASIKQLTAAKEQMDENTNGKIKDLLNVHKNSVKDLEKRIKEGDDTLRTRLDTLDRTLVGRLSELETLFGSRAATKYVDDSLRELEERLKRLLDSNNNVMENSLFGIKRDLEQITKKEIDTMKNQLLACEDSIRHLKSELELRVTVQVLKDTTKKLEDGINSTLTTKIRDSMKKYEPIIDGFEEFKRFKVNFMEHEDRYMEFQTKTILMNEVTEIKNAPPPVVEQRIELPHIPQIDENEFEDMKYNIKNMKGEHTKLEEQVKKLKGMLDDRVDKSTFKTAIDLKLNKDEVFSILQDFAAKDERIKAMHQTLQATMKTLDYLSDKIDRKILKLKKELDLTSIQKLLKSKADDNEVKKEFESMDFRVKTVDDTLGSVKKDLDGMFTSLKKITDVITLLQQDQATAIGSTRNALCLSCGRGDATFLPPMKQTKGADGNYYLTHQPLKVHGKVVNSRDDIDFGYEVFDKQEVTREHVKVSHEPVETWMERPNTSGGMRQSKDPNGNIRNPRRIQTNVTLPKA